jgi:hypothetical protein
MPIKLGDNLVLFDIRELSDTLEVTPLTLKSYINKGKLKGQKLGNKWYVSEISLQEYFNQERVKPKRTKRSRAQK